jgi:peptidoglycan hydrolase CwlO-like protein
MISNYLIKLLIFLILVLFISQLSNLSLFKWLNLQKNVREGMDECSQNEKDELYKQKLRIDEIKKKTSKISNDIRNLEKNIDANKGKIASNTDKLKSVAEKSKQEKNKAEKASEGIKY